MGGAHRLLACRFRSGCIRGPTSTYMAPEQAQFRASKAWCRLEKASMNSSNSG